MTPHQSTIQRLFRCLGAEELEAAFRSLLLPEVHGEQEERGACAVAIDRKAQKGRLPFEKEQGYPVHAVSLLAHQTGIVLSQGHVEKSDLLTTGPSGEGTESEEQKQKKRTGGSRSPPATGGVERQSAHWDALYCQRSLCTTRRSVGGDDLFLIKGNQSQLFSDVQLLFAPPAPAKRAGEEILRLPEQTTCTSEKGHGRVEIRRIWVSGELTKATPTGLEQVFEIRRCWQSKGQSHEAIRYGVTSLPARLALPEHLLTLKRGHWMILHHVKDVTMGEGKSTLHLGNGPKILAALRNSALSLLRRAGYRAIAARLRYHSTHPHAVLQVLSLPCLENA